MKNLSYFLFCAMMTFSMMSCGQSASSQKEERFWEGVVKPGTYYISWRETSAYGENANKVSLEITIFDNREFEIRQKTECGLARVYHSDVRLLEGIMVKMHEMYNGTEKVWYNFPSQGDDFSVTPSGDFYRGGFEHWQSPWGGVHQSVGRIY